MLQLPLCMYQRKMIYLTQIDKKCKRQIKENKASLE